MKEYLELLDVLNDAWRAVRLENLEIPESVVTVATGGRRALSHYGWFVGETWIKTDPDDHQQMLGNGTYHEITLIAEQLHRPAPEVFTTLLHEAVHGLAFARGIKDVSGVRHNKKFAHLAYEVGLIPPEKPDKRIGFSNCEISPGTLYIYSNEIKQLDQALSICRVVKIDKAKKPPKRSKCDCREAPLSKKFLDDGDVICGNCNEPFRFPSSK